MIFFVIGNLKVDFGGEEVSWRLYLIYLISWIYVRYT